MTTSSTSKKGANVRLVALKIGASAKEMVKYAPYFVFVRTENKTLVDRNDNI